MALQYLDDFLGWTGGEGVIDGLRFAAGIHQSVSAQLGQVLAQR